MKFPKKATFCVVVHVEFAQTPFPEQSSFDTQTTNARSVSRLSLYSPALVASCARSAAEIVGADVGRGIGRDNMENAWARGDNVGALDGSGVGNGVVGRVGAKVAQVGCADGADGCCVGDREG